MAQYKLHCFCQSGNSYKAALYLQCAGLDWEPVHVDFFNGQTRDPKWRETVNEMGEAPVLEDGATRLAQSGVILTYHGISSSMGEGSGPFRPPVAVLGVVAFALVLLIGQANMRLESPIAAPMPPSCSGRTDTTWATPRGRCGSISTTSHRQRRTCPTDWPSATCGRGRTIGRSSR